jgi:hypothetical protein
VFHEARYNLALCRYLYARTQKAKDQTKGFQAAERSIVETQLTYGTGPEWEAWKPKYTKLIMDIQQALGQKPVGLPESTLPTAPGPATAKVP